MEDDVEHARRAEEAVAGEGFDVELGEGYEKERKAAGRLGKALGCTVLALALVAALGLLVCPMVLHFEGESNVWAYDERDLEGSVEDPSGGDPVEVRRLLTKEYHADLTYEFWNDAKGESMDHAMVRVFEAFRKATGLDISGDRPVERSLVRLEEVWRGVRTQQGYDLEQCTAYDFVPPDSCGDLSEVDYEEYDFTECEPPTSIQLRVRHLEATLLPEGQDSSGGVEVELRSVDHDQRVAVDRNFLPIYDAASTCSAEVQQDIFRDCTRHFSNQAQITHVSSSVTFQKCKDILLYFPNCFDRQDGPFDSSQRDNEVTERSSGMAHVVWEDRRSGLDKRSGVRFRFSTTFEFPTVEDAIAQANEDLRGDVVLAIYSPDDGKAPWNEVLNVMTEDWYTRLLGELLDDEFLPCH